MKEIAMQEREGKFDNKTDYVSSAKIVFHISDLISFHYNGSSNDSISIDSALKKKKRPPSIFRLREGNYSQC